MISLRSSRNLATLLSVALAVTGLVASFNYSATAERRILGSLDALSPDLLVVGYREERGDVHRLRDDVDILRHALESDGLAPRIAPLAIRWFQTVDVRGEPLFGCLVFSTPELESILNLDMAPPYPKRDSPLEGLRHPATAIPAASLAPFLTGGGPEAGASVTLDGRSLFIAAVFRCRDRLLGIDWNHSILLPFAAWDARKQPQSLRILVQVAGGVNERVERRVESALMLTRADQDFSLRQFEDLRRQKRKIARAIRLLTETISLVILLMASIGCMNIFFITVSERTREIGLRRALGATGPEMIRLVMADCYGFMGLGAALGVAGGYGFTLYLMRPLLQIMPEFAGWDFELHPDALLKTLSYLLAGSTLAGLFPALRAARIEPAVALRE